MTWRANIYPVSNSTFLGKLHEFSKEEAYKMLLQQNVKNPWLPTLTTDWGAHNNAVFDVEWSQRENKLLTASGDQTVCLWDVPTETKLLTFKGHTSSVRSVRYRPDDNGTWSHTYLLVYVFLQVDFHSSFEHKIQ